LNEHRAIVLQAKVKEKNSKKSAEKINTAAG